MKKRIVNLSVIFGFLMAGLSLGADSPFLPGLTVADEHPNGCVDCHKVDGANDYRLNVELAKENHINVDAMTNTVPNDCFMCHKTDSNPLSGQTHSAHYKNPADNAFVNSYQGACLNCHKLDTNTGAMSVKSGPKNW